MRQELLEWHKWEIHVVFLDVTEGSIEGVREAVIIYYANDTIFLNNSVNSYKNLLLMDAGISCESHRWLKAIWSYSRENLGIPYCTFWVISLCLSF